MKPFEKKPVKVTLHIDFQNDGVYYHTHKPGVVEAKHPCLFPGCEEEHIVRKIMES
jgi:hypothetical protein